MDVDYKKYKWFFTSSGKLIVGGKSAEQNDELLTLLKATGKDYLAMHTREPGSPFSIIISDEELKKSDLEECAVFTASFSRAWKSKASKAVVDIFSLGNLSKSRLMKTGTWGVSEKQGSREVKLELVLAVQENTLRAIPEKSAKKALLKIIPGAIDKEKQADKIALLLKGKFSKQNILQALPAGGVKIVK